MNETQFAKSLADLALESYSGGPLTPEGRRVSMSGHVQIRIGGGILEGVWASVDYEDSESNLSRITAAYVGSDGDICYTHSILITKENRS